MQDAFILLLGRSDGCNPRPFRPFPVFAFFHFKLYGAFLFWVVCCVMEFIAGKKERN